MGKTNITRAKKEIESAIESVEKEIALHENSQGTVSNVTELKNIDQTLKEMLNSINSQACDWKHVGMGHLIVDSWPIGSDLGSKILKAEQEYRKLL